MDNFESSEEMDDPNQNTENVNVEDLEEFQRSLYKCFHCKIVFINESFWKSHQESVHQPKSEIKCDTCIKTFASQNELNRHVQEIHEKTKNFQCSICKSTFSRKYSCKNHLQKVHHVEKSDDLILMIQNHDKNQENQEPEQIETFPEDSIDFELSNENVIVVKQDFDQGTV